MEKTFIIRYRISNFDWKPLPPEMISVEAALDKAYKDGVPNPMLEAGDEIYVDSEWYPLEYKMSNIAGGLATIKRVTKNESGWEVFHVKKVDTNVTCGLRFLPEQEQLRKRFGDQRAHYE